ncbi:hypothetical protein [Bizionia sp.]|uniref:hypothetical protein n=1 Tax=Bizionia sp. TaxID=1954480 RepID=UPI003A8D3840
MTKWKVTIIGTGKLGNSPKMINEIFELDENTIRDLSNPSTKEQVIKGLLLTRLAGVEIDVNKLGVNREEIRKPIIKNETLKNVGKSAIAGAIGGAIVNKTSKRKKERKVEVKEDDENITSFVHELSHLHNLSFANDVNDITNKLDEIYYGIKSYKWKSASGHKKESIINENNRCLTKCLNKYKQGLSILYKTSDDEEIKKQYNRKLKWLKLKKAFNKYGLFIGLFIVMLILAIML